ncbi:TPA: cadherin repeat domain-containing protein [Aeromonas veronii]|nr:cadherin repeat domain-containing protein [Aeromonas veronii]
MNNINKSGHKRPIIRRTKVAAGLLAALLSHGAAALVSTNSAGPIHGRQITVVATPKIAGLGLVGVPVTLPAVPGTADADGDTLADWYYVWQLDGVDVGTEKLAGSIDAIPAYTPKAADSGKALTLKLRAVADARSFPETTRFSAASLSNKITIAAGSVDIGNGEIKANPNIKESIGIDANGKGHGSENKEIKVDIGSSVTNNNTGGKLEWGVSGQDSAQFTIDKDGVLTLKPQDAEKPLDSDANGSYTVVVTVTDPATGAKDNTTITITVDNVVEVATAVKVVDAKGAAITGNPIVGDTLHAAVTLNDGAGEKLDRADATFKWERRNTTVTDGKWEAVKDAVGATYKLTGADQGYEFRVDASGK